jgi:hypothetical protein
LYSFYLYFFWFYKSCIQLASYQTDPHLIIAFFFFLLSSFAAFIPPPLFTPVEIKDS